MEPATRKSTRERKAPITLAAEQAAEIAKRPKKTQSIEDFVFFLPEEPCPPETRPEVQTNNNPININLDLYNVFRENYGINTPEDIFNLWGININEPFGMIRYVLKQFKWIICFYLLMYLDYLHDFHSVRTPINQNHIDNNKRIRHAMTKLLIENITQLCNSYFIQNNLAGTFDNIIDCIFGEIQLDDYIPANISPTWYNQYYESRNANFIVDSKIYELLANLNTKNFINVSSDGDIKIWTEYCRVIMGVQKVRFNRFEKSNYLPTDIPTIDQDICFSNRYNPSMMHPHGTNGIMVTPEDIRTSNFPYLITVDSVQSTSKWTPMTRMIYNTIKKDRNEVIYISSIIDQIDGAATNNPIKSSLQRICSNRIKIRNDLGPLNFNLNFNLNGQQLIPMMNYSIRQGNFTINKYFNIIEQPLVYDNFSTISLSDVLSRMYTFNFSHQYTPFKTLLDFSKIIFFHNQINNSINLHTLMVFNDIIAADIGSIFIRGAGLEQANLNPEEEARANIYDKQYTYFLRSYILREIFNQKHPGTLTTPYMSNRQVVNPGAFGKKRIGKSQISLREINKMLGYLNKF
uniref:Uncharacterized protein n=1 Tax=viral metagenome TaxID=1070528 RepID=A0A6C0I9V9_9ZZZZ